MTYHILRNGERLGPYPEEQIRRLLAGGQLQGGDLAWREGLADWVPLRSLVFLAAPGSGEQAENRPAPPARRKSSPMGFGTKLLITLGAAGFVLIAVTAGYLFTHLFQLNKSAQDYAENYVAHIAPAWSSDELLRHVTPEYRDKFPKADTDALFKQLSALGKLKHAGPGTANTTFNSTLTGSKMVAVVVVKATFDGGDATFNFYLIQSGSEWTIAGFHVQLPLTKK